ncbi:ABC transporter related protein [Caldicellulosiruptor hydrothermalis 108]|uniref:ABC transporter related protein n=1 Tax=Caldicellulosiruptor hydrothermalis (strain DSM 18901 / VKM B-2411 / 108) TaxID=632292 RepID=E4Q8S3_CALH1|nr:sugar ABC transporter ATP-binding protein [Caldicellulosiruptor hydrothermalis]ADQ08047.1 ABC transporter related protein [Caldicellulosiruptor hydrothermalis 108]
MSVEKLIEVRNIDKYFGPVKVLNNVCLEIYKGEVRGLVGENGSGKSTLSSIIAGILQADGGKMFLKGNIYNPKSMIDAQTHGIGMVVQELGTVSNITVAENIFLGKVNNFKRFGIVDRKKLYKSAKEILERVGITDIDPAIPINFLNFEDRKLIEFAKVVDENLELLILDETTTALSQKGREIVYDLVQKLKSQNKSVLLISHDLDEIMKVCDTLTVLRDGNVITELPKQEFEENKIKQYMIGREIKGHYYRPDAEGSHEEEVVLKIKNLTTFRGVKNLSFEVHKGEILGIGGLSHCGMHELGRALFGAEKVLTGRVIHCKTGQEIKSPFAAMKLNIGYVSKDRDKESLVLADSIKNNIVAAGYDKVTTGKYFIFPKTENKYVDEQIESLRIKCTSRNQYVQYLSGGNKQKVALGKWLARDPDILIVDCPTRGVDVGVKASIYQILYQMKKEGKTIIMISEELPELIGMCDRIIILKDGRKTGEFKRSPDLSEANLIMCMI